MAAKENICTRLGDPTGARGCVVGFAPLGDSVVHANVC